MLNKTAGNGRKNATRYRIAREYSGLASAGVTQRS